MLLVDLGTVGVKLERWVEETLPRTLHGPTSLHPFPFCALQKELTSYGLHLMSGKCYFTCVSCLQRWVGILCLLMTLIVIITEVPDFLHRDYKKNTQKE